MSDLDVQQVLSARYRTSQIADKHTDQLRQNLGLATKAQVARLALGRSLGMGAMGDVTIDAKGMDIPATSLFTADDIGAWIGMLVTHSLANEGRGLESMDALRGAIRLHWHRGAIALWDDWIASEENYDRFIETLVLRRSDMPEYAEKRIGPDAPGSDSGKAVGVPEDASGALTKALGELGIKVQVKDATHGPRISRYRVLLMNLSDSAKLNRNMPQLALALNLGSALPTVANGDEAKTVFIDLPRARATWKAVGIDRLRTWAQSGSKSNKTLLVYAGVTVTGEDVVFDLASVPHLLVGGTTGSGKSVCLHSLILSLLMRHKPETLQLALIDPKQVEFSAYAKLPNLYGGLIATEISQARQFLQDLVDEMERRYAEFNRIGVVNIGEARLKKHTMPFIVVFIEELADLVLQDPGLEDLIARLAQKARAAGIHLVLATQRPDSDTFSGLIRSNIPGRIALAVQKGTESNIILDEKGAENLLGMGDMLIRLPGEALVRAHGVFVRPENVAQIVASVIRK